jgi:hypothetical protein
MSPVVSSTMSLACISSRGDRSATSSALRQKLTCTALIELVRFVP